MKKQEDLIEIAKKIRRLCVKMSSEKRASHLGCALSMIDILTYLYYEQMDHDRDEFILSKGHAVIGLYAILFDRGIVTRSEYDSYRENGSYLIDHPQHKVSGITISTGALGHGPALAAGKAWGRQMKNEPGVTYCMVGDGEMQEGSVWEALLFASRNSLFKNLVIIVDLNNYQGFSDSSDSLVPHSALIDMLKSTGLDVRVIDGHNFDEIRNSLSDELYAPRIVVAKTTKGRGVSFMENRFEWHYKSPDRAQLIQALGELS